MHTKEAFGSCRLYGANSLIQRPEHSLNPSSTSLTPRQWHTESTHTHIATDTHRITEIHSHLHTHAHTHTLKQSSAWWSLKLRAKADIDLIGWSLSLPLSQILPVPAFLFFLSLSLSLVLPLYTSLSNTVSTNDSFRVVWSLRCSYLSHQSHVTVSHSFLFC